MSKIVHYFAQRFSVQAGIRLTTHKTEGLDTCGTGLEQDTPAFSYCTARGIYIIYEQDMPAWNTFFVFIHDPELALDLQLSLPEAQLVLLPGMVFSFHERDIGYTQLIQHKAYLVITPGPAGAGRYRYRA